MVAAVRRPVPGRRRGYRSSRAVSGLVGVGWHTGWRRSRRPTSVRLGWLRTPSTGADHAPGKPTVGPLRDRFYAGSGLPMLGFNDVGAEGASFRARTSLAARRRQVFLGFTGGPRAVVPSARRGLGDSGGAVVADSARGGR